MVDETGIESPAWADRTDAYRFGYTHEELERLGHQHRVWADENRRFISRAGFETGSTLVDLGCGPGYATLDLARAVGPAGTVIAVDRDGERSLARLRSQAKAAGLSNIETRAANLETFDLHEESVDGVYGRWVLMYLPEAAAASLVGRIANWLRPGGVCALTELCNFGHMHVHPGSRYLPEIAGALARAVAGDRHCNPEIGNDLPGLLCSAGLDVEINVSTKAVRATTQEWRWPDALFRDHLPALVEEGLLAQRTLDEFLVEWEARSKDPASIFFASPMMEVIGRRSQS